jgi:hypothetical protein
MAATIRVLLLSLVGDLAGTMGDEYSVAIDQLQTAILLLVSETNVEESEEIIIRLVIFSRGKTVRGASVRSFLAPAF